MPTSNQINELTTSTNGRNVRAKLQPKSHFFVENASFTQSSSQAFGASSTNVFRTTAKISVTGSKDIYAICQGQLFVQPQTGSPTKVNVILKPFKQPINGLGIKYFIYRGLTKSDFVVGGELVASGTTGLTQFLQDQFENFYDNGVDPLPTFAEHFIGLPTSVNSATSQNGTDLIEQYFNKVTTVINPTTGEEDPNLMFELPIVPAGMHLSTVSGEIGLDVVLDSGEYYIENDPDPFKLDLTFARLADSEIDITSVTDPYQIKLFKEACTQFMDIAAFYGLHANGAGKLVMDDGVAPPLTAAADIYAKLAGFHTKNNLYIYIQANRQRSYNFYENYEHSSGNANTINIGGTEATMTEMTFGTLGWPIHVFNETQIAGTSFNTLCFQLTTDNNEGANLYVHAGYLSSENEIGFMRCENLLEDPNSLVDLSFTKIIKCETPSEGANTISGLLNFIYEGKLLLVEEHFLIPPANSVSHEIKDIDDMFGLINAKSLKTSLSQEELPIIVDERLQVVNFPKQSGLPDIGAIKVKKVEDKIQTVDDNTFSQRVTYESLMSSIQQESMPLKASASSSIDIAATGSRKYGTSERPFYVPSAPYYFRTLLFSDNEKTITGLVLTEENNKIPAKKILGLTKAEYDEIETVVTTNFLCNSKLFFSAKSSNDSLEVGSNQNVAFQSFVIGVIGENNIGRLKLYFTAEEIVVYTIDGCVYSSKEYAESTPELVPNEEITYLNFGPWKQG